MVLRDGISKIEIPSWGRQGSSRLEPETLEVYGGTMGKLPKPGRRRSPLGVGCDLDDLEPSKLHIRRYHRRRIRIPRAKKKQHAK